VSSADVRSVHVEEIETARQAVEAAEMRGAREPEDVERLATLYDDLAAAYHSAAEHESNPTWRRILADAAAGMRSITRRWDEQTGGGQL
jgi:hypothetical protein